MRGIFFFQEKENKNRDQNEEEAWEILGAQGDPGQRKVTYESVHIHMPVPTWLFVLASNFWLIARIQQE